MSGERKDLHDHNIDHDTVSENVEYRPIDEKTLENILRSTRESIEFVKHNIIFLDKLGCGKPEEKLDY